MTPMRISTFPVHVTSAVCTVQEKAIAPTKWLATTAQKTSLASSSMRKVRLASQEVAPSKPLAIMTAMPPTQGTAGTLQPVTIALVSA